MSKKYFGTDGVRGTVGKDPMTADFELRLASAAAQSKLGEGEHRGILAAVSRARRADAGVAGRAAGIRSSRRKRLLAVPESDSLPGYSLRAFGRLT